MNNISLFPTKTIPKQRMEVKRLPIILLILFSKEVIDVRLSYDVIVTCFSQSSQGLHFQ